MGTYTAKSGRSLNKRMGVIDWLVVVLAQAALAAGALAWLFWRRARAVRGAMADLTALSETAAETLERAKTLLAEAAQAPAPAADPPSDPEIDAQKPDPQDLAALAQDVDGANPEESAPDETPDDDDPTADLASDQPAAEPPDAELSPEGEAELAAAKAEVAALNARIAELEAEQPSSTEDEDLKELLQQFTRDSRDMLSCIQGLEEENQTLRQQLNAQTENAA